MDWDICLSVRLCYCCTLFGYYKCFLNAFDENMDKVSISPSLLNMLCVVEKTSATVNAETFQIRVEINEDDGRAELTVNKVEFSQTFMI